MEGHFRPPSSFQPLRILLRVAILQICHTFIFWGMILLITALKAHEVKFPWPHLTIVFHPNILLQMRPLALIISGFFVCSVVMGFLLQLIVGRSRDCLDYGVTLYSVHFVVCFVLQGRVIFTNALWMCLVFIMQAILTIQVGRWRCQQIELLPIPLGVTVPDSSIVIEPKLHQNSPLLRLKFLLPSINGRIAAILNHIIARSHHEKNSNTSASYL